MHRIRPMTPGVSDGELGNEVPVCLRKPPFPRMALPVVNRWPLSSKVTCLWPALWYWCCALYTYLIGQPLYSCLVRLSEYRVPEGHWKVIIRARARTGFPGYLQAPMARLPEVLPNGVSSPAGLAGIPAGGFLLACSDCGIRLTSHPCSGQYHTLSFQIWILALGEGYPFFPQTKR